MTGPIQHIASSGAPILVVDDDPAVLSGIELFLQVAGYQTITAQNGAKALERMREARPALVLLDLMMPVMDGQQFLDSLQSPEYLPYRDIPVVLMTANEHGSRSAQQLGVRGFLSKPFQPAELLQVVDSLQVHASPQPHIC